LPADGVADVPKKQAFGTSGWQLADKLSSMSGAYIVGNAAGRTSGGPALPDRAVPFVPQAV